MNQKIRLDAVFHEEQRFRQTWVMMVVFLVAGLQWVTAVEQLLMGRPFGQKPMPDTMAFVFFILFGIGLPMFFFFNCLVTEVLDDGIYFRWIPIQRSFRRIAFTDLARCELKTYHAIRDYGGWGIRWRCKGKAYIVSGDRGVQFELKNGKRILIGTHRADEFWQVIPAKVRAQA